MTQAATQIAPQDIERVMDRAIVEIETGDRKQGVAALRYGYNALPASNRKPYDEYLKWVKGGKQGPAPKKYRYLLEEPSAMEVAGAAPKLIGQGLAEGVASTIDVTKVFGVDTGLGDAVRGLGPDIEDPRVAGTFGGQVASGVGSAASFLLGGLAARGLKIGPRIAAAVMGSAQNSSSAYEQAIAEGLDREDALVAAAVGAATGTTEALGAGGRAAQLGKNLRPVLSKWDELSKGRLSQVLRAGLEEGSQEAFQQATNEAVLEKLTGKDRAVLREAAQAFGPASVVGMLFEAGFRGAAKAPDAIPLSEDALASVDRALEVEGLSEEGRTTLARRAVSPDPRTPLGKAVRPLQARGVEVAILPEDYVPKKFRGASHAGTVVLPMGEVAAARRLAWHEALHAAQPPPEAVLAAYQAIGEMAPELVRDVTGDALASLESVGQEQTDPAVLEESVALLAENLPNVLDAVLDDPALAAGFGRSNPTLFGALLDQFVRALRKIGIKLPNRHERALKALEKRLDTNAERSLTSLEAAEIGLEIGKLFHVEQEGGAQAEATQPVEPQAVADVTGAPQAGITTASGGALTTGTAPTPGQVLIAASGTRISTSPAAAAPPTPSSEPGTPSRHAVASGPAAAEPRDTRTPAQRRREEKKARKAAAKAKALREAPAKDGDEARAQLREARAIEATIPKSFDRGEVRKPVDRHKANIALAAELADRTGDVKYAGVLEGARGVYATSQDQQFRLRARSAIQDYLAPAEAALGPESRAMVARRLAAGKAGTAVEDIVLKAGETVSKRLEAGGWVLEHLDSYLMAWDALGRNKWFRGLKERIAAWRAEVKAIEKEIRAVAKDLAQEEDPSRRQGLREVQAALRVKRDQLRVQIDRYKLNKRSEDAAGISDEEARKLIKEYEGAKGFADLHAAAEAIWAMNKAKNAHMEKLGTISKGGARALEARWERYVPAKDDFDGSPWRTNAQDVSVRGPEWKRPRGRYTPSSNNTSHALADAASALIRAEMNRAGEALATQVEQGGLRANVRPIGHGSYQNGKLQDPADTEVYFKRNGVDWKVEFGKEHEAIAKAWRGKDLQRAEGATQLVAAMTRKLAQLSTQYNPAFPLPNLFRDAITAGITLSGEKGKRVAWEAMKRVPGSLRAYWRFVQHGETSEVVDRYRKAGGPISILGAFDFREARREINRGLRMGKKPGWKRFGRGFLNLMDKINQTFENATRIAAFEVATRSKEDGGLGMTDDQAALYAKDLTLNFETKGEIGNILSAYYMFANPGIQGTARIWKSMVMPGSKTARYTGYIAMMGFMTDVLNRTLGGEDEEGTPIWDKIPEWEKNYNFIMMIPGTESWIKIPLPYGYNFFHAAGNYVAGLTARHLFGHRGYTVSDAILGTASSAMDSFNPLGGAADPIDIAMPTVLDPWVQHWRNQDWTGAPIMPSKFPGSATPDSSLHWASVNPVAEWVSDTLNTIGGGDKRTSAALSVMDVSPETIEHVVQFVTGGLGRSILRAGKVVASPATDTEIKAPDIPIARRFFGGTTGFEDLRLFYDNASQAEGIGERIAGHRQDKDFKAAAALAKDPRGRMADRARRIRKRLKVLREQLEVDPDNDRAKEAAMRLVRQFNRDFEEAR